MDFTPEEIAFVEFCESQEPEVICTAGARGRKRRGCPAAEHCDDEDPECSQILVEMKENRELTQEHVDIIRFWVRDIKWDERNCVPNGGGQCHNYESEACAHDNVCVGLLRKLGVYDPDEYDVYEKTIQEVVVKGLRSSRSDWHTVERLEYHSEKPPIAVGKPDILCIGARSKNLYVIELKAVQATRRDVGQLASYVGWYRDHPEDRPVPCRDKDVVGILLARDLNAGAEYALRACANLHGRRFDLHVEIIKPIEQAV